MSALLSPVVRLISLHSPAFLRHDVYLSCDFDFDFDFDFFNVIPGLHGVVIIILFSFFSGLECDLILE